MAQRSALGKGLGALLPSSPAAVSEIPLFKIKVNPFQPRQDFDEDALQELCESIRTLGIIQPLTLRQDGLDSYQIISGERRFRAAKMAGLKSVPAYVRKADDRAMLEMAIVENIQRENLDAIETALSFQRLIDECGLTQEEMAERVGKKRATVTNYLRLLRLPDEIQKAIKTGEISTGHAKALLSIEDPEIQKALCAGTIQGDWSVRVLEQKAQATARQEPPAPAPEAEPLPEVFNSFSEKVGKHFRNHIAVKRNSRGGGSITIRFDNEKQISDFLDTIKE